MNLPSQTALEDAEAQLEYAAGLAAPLVELLQHRTDTPPTDPAHRPRYEQNCALLSALSGYFAAVSHLAATHGQQVREMRQEMGAAQFRYNQMGIERDYLKAELQQANARYYANLDLFTALEARLSARASA